MGWDVKATTDQIAEAVDNLPKPDFAQVSGRAQAAATHVSDAISANPASFISTTVAVFVLMSLVGLLWRLRKRLASALEDTLFSNWRLALLGTTGLVLSLASGYTTWDGMRNFTGEAVLSLMVTFGIQGVMLIVAWLIGESFAIGMNQQSSKTAPSSAMQPVLGALVGIALFIVATAYFLHGGGPASQGVSWEAFGNKAAIIGVGLLVVAFVTVYAASDLVQPYLQSGRVIIKNSVLWVMFLACMGTSVFFSFDSLFSAIFPQSERVRAAELRAQKQVAGILADIEGKITDGRLREAQNLFHNTSYEAYDAQLTKLAELSRASAPTIEAYFNSQIEERNRAIKQQQERMSTAQGGQAGLAGKKTSIGEELSRLKGDRPGLAAEYAQKKSDLETKQKDADAKRVEAMAEAGGVEGTGKEGKGPIYRQRVDELGKAQAAVKIAEERLNDAKKRLATTETRITQIEREQSALDGDLAKLKGEAETAEQRIKLVQEQLPTDAGARVDPSRITPAFEVIKAEFRQDPTVERLAKLQQSCSQIYTAMTTATPATKKLVAGIDCDPKQAAEAASVVFALNAGTATFNATCKGGDKLNAHGTADALFGFARKCLADSGLLSQETEELRDKINFIELNRDDKAHRFVVTWNAFQDGNRLAYLALGIAIAIDSLVFMSGLFGANAVRSPLSDVPSTKARSAQQLEGTINAALGKLPYETAMLVLNAMRPMKYDNGFTALITLDGPDALANDRIRSVLTAGADIHAVEPVTGYQYRAETYKVRGELREYLSSICDKHFKADKSIAAQARLEQVLSVALKPHVHEHADIVLNNLHPMKLANGCTSYVSLAALDAYDTRIVRRVINAATTVQAASPDENPQDEAKRYYFKPECVHALQTLLAHSIKSPGFEADRWRALQQAQGGQLEGGVLNGSMPRLPGHEGQRALTGPQAGREKFDVPGFLAAAGSQGEPDFLGSLLSALGMEPDVFANMSDDTFAAALSASETFARVRRGNALLDRALTQRDEEARVSMDRAYYRLEGKLAPDDSRNRQRLTDAFQDLDQNWPILMLMPGSPYERAIAETIEKLEQAAGEAELPDDENRMLQSVRQLRRTIEGNGRHNQQQWQHLEKMLVASNQQPPPPLPSNKPTLQ